MNTKSSWTTFLGASAAAGLLTACVATVQPAGYYVAEGPPPTQVEVTPVAQGPEYIWIGGYWGWHDRWVWEPGHYERRPHPGARWESGRWEHHRRGYVWHEGHWR